MAHITLDKLASQLAILSDDVESRFQCVEERLRSLRRDTVKQAVGFEKYKSDNDKEVETILKRIPAVVDMLLAEAMREVHEKLHAHNEFVVNKTNQVVGDSETMIKLATTQIETLHARSTEAAAQLEGLQTLLLDRIQELETQVHDGLADVQSRQKHLTQVTARLTSARGRSPPRSLSNESRQSMASLPHSHISQGSRFSAGYESGEDVAHRRRQHVHSINVRISDARQVALRRRHREEQAKLPVTAVSNAGFRPGPCCDQQSQSRWPQTTPIDGEGPLCANQTLIDPTCIPYHGPCGTGTP